MDCILPYVQIRSLVICMSSCPLQKLLYIKDGEALSLDPFFQLHIADALHVLPGLKIGLQHDGSAPWAINRFDDTNSQLFSHILLEQLQLRSIHLWPSFTIVRICIFLQVMVCSIREVLWNWETKVAKTCLYLHNICRRLNCWEEDKS